MIFIVLMLTTGALSQDPPSTAAVSVALTGFKAAGLDATEARLRALGEAGDTSAWEGLGELINFAGPRTPAGRSTMCAAYERAASVRGDAAHNFGNCYFYGDGRPRDQIAAARWYQAGIDRGFVRSSCALGNLLVASGKPDDIARGVALCRSAAAAGEAEAQTDLGQFLLLGTVLPRDVVAARKEFAKAAAQGQVNAAFLLGQILWNGDGIAEDRPGAARYWRQAFEGGRKDAAMLLGNEALGRFVESAEPRELAMLAEAKRWYTIVAADGSDAAREQANKELKRIDEIETGLAKLRATQ